MLSWTGIPDRWQIVLTYSDQTARDDNLAITLVSDRGDLVAIVIASRTEPFEGINETINLQCGELIAKIDDFRTMDVWRRQSHSRFHYNPKDAGHDLAILQPFSEEKRDWREIELSTCLMLFIAEMVVEGIQKREFSFSREMSRLEGSP